MSKVRALAVAMTLFAAMPIVAVQPERAYVPNAETAISMAIAVWKLMFGEKALEKARPFQAESRGDVWIVMGSLPPGATRGGSLEAEISKRDGRAIRAGAGR